MASVVLKEGREFDGTDTCRVVSNYLPVYARPRFIRIQVSHVQNLVRQTALLQPFFVSSSCFPPKRISPTEFFGTHRNFQDEKGEAGGGGL